MLRALNTCIAPLDGSEESPKEILTFEALTAFAKKLTQDLPIKFFPNDLLAVVIPHKLGKKRTGETTADALNAETDQQETLGAKQLQSLRSKRKVDILNSFYLRDLEKVHEHLVKQTKDSGTPLSLFLSHGLEAENKIDLMDPANSQLVSELTSPQSTTSARWLNSSRACLGLHQQFVVNQYFNTDAKLQAVNGPPGTGKSTVVRDILAEVIVRRALKLAKLNKPAEALSAASYEIATARSNINTRFLVPDFEGLEVVIASNNNAAVENISQELPKTSAICQEEFEISYLTRTARLYQQLRLKDDNALLEQYWGFPSVALCNSRNRKLFCRAAFNFQYEESKLETAERLERAELLTIQEWRKKALAGHLSFNQAKKAFLAAYNTFQAWQTTNTQNFSASGTNDTRDQNWQLKPAALDQNSNTLRSNLLKAALNLQEAWIRETPGLEKELAAISTLLRRPGAIDPNYAARIWQLLFMIIPAVSTTLASVERMFSSLAANTIGNVIIDEASQASPQSVLGILMRAKKALIIGDQRQIEPIVICPDCLEAKLAQSLMPELRVRYSPLKYSAQSITDSLNRYGTYLSAGFETKLWIAVPLCVHRRCASPMFEISNSIAYDNLMIHAQPRSQKHAILSESAWFDVKGACSSKQWAAAQLEVVFEILQNLGLY